MSVHLEKSSVSQPHPEQVYNMLLKSEFILCKVLWFFLTSGHLPKYFFSNYFSEGTASHSASTWGFQKNHLTHLSMVLYTCMKIYYYQELLLSHVATLPQKIWDTGIVPPCKTWKSVTHIALLNPLMQTPGSKRRNIGVSHIHGKHTAAYHYKINFCTGRTMKQPYFPLPLGVMICTLNSECMKTALPQVSFTSTSKQTSQL